jgi:transcriptional regulator with GAF, ATPase, and Fis domain
VALRQTTDTDLLHPWENFVLRDWTHAAEKEFIEMALREAEGKISVAAKLLGFDHYESLNSIIKSRHKDLLEVRTKPIPRRRSIIKIKRQTKRK